MIKIIVKKQVLFNANLDGLDKEADWYTIVTLYNYEDIVANKLNELSKIPEYSEFIFGGFPGIKKTKEHYINKKGEYKIKNKNTKVFSNYCFVKCKMTPEIWNTLMNITGFSSIICISGRPVGTREEKIKEVKEMLKPEEIITGTKKEVEKILDTLGNDFVNKYNAKIKYIE